MNRKIFWCDKTGMEQILLSFPGADAAHCYFTSNSWADGETLILARMENRKFSHACSLIKVNIHTGEEILLTQKARWPMYIVWGGFVYHMTEHDLYRTELTTLKTELLWEGDARYTLDGPPSITEDGRYISVYWTLADKQTSICRFDLQEKRMEEFCKMSFPYPFEQANHCMLNPKNPDQMFFSHEGNCVYITNRLWLCDFKTHTARNLFKQKLDESGRNGEPCGHEMWAPDGKGIFFIKYISTTIPPKGVWYFDLEKDEARPVASQYEYWHVAAAPDSVRTASDTQIPGEVSEVVLVDPIKKLEKVVALAKTDWTHPCHPHPQFSPDGNDLCYTALGEDGHTVVGVVRVDSKN